MGLGRGADRTWLSSWYGQALWSSLYCPAEQSHVSAPHLQSNPTQRMQCIFLSFPPAGSIGFCPPRHQVAWSGGPSAETGSQGDSSASKDHLHLEPPLPFIKKKKTKTHPPNLVSQHTLLSPAWLMYPDTRTSPVNWPNELTTAPA